jgi:hypothetical protein
VEDTMADGSKSHHWEVSYNLYNRVSEASGHLWTLVADLKVDGALVFTTPNFSVSRRCYTQNGTHRSGPLPDSIFAKINSVTIREITPGAQKGC